MQISQKPRGTVQLVEVLGYSCAYIGKLRPSRYGWYRLASEIGGGQRISVEAAMEHPSIRSDYCFFFLSSYTTAQYISNEYRDTSEHRSYRYLKLPGRASCSFPSYPDGHLTTHGYDMTAKRRRCLFRGLNSFRLSGVNATCQRSCHRK